MCRLISLNLGVEDVIKFDNISPIFAPLRTPASNFNNNERPSPKDHT